MYYGHVMKSADNYLSSVSSQPTKFIVAMEFCFHEIIIMVFQNHIGIVVFNLIILT